MKVRYGGEMREEGVTEVGVGKEGDPGMRKGEVPT